MVGPGQTIRDVNTYEFEADLYIDPVKRIGMWSINFSFLKSTKGSLILLILREKVLLPHYPTVFFISLMYTNSLPTYDSANKSGVVCKFEDKTVTQIVGVDICFIAIMK